MRAWEAAVLWSWVFTGLRFGSVLVVLPLLSRLPESDFGFYYLLMSIVAVAPLIDLGFAFSVERGVGYAMAGATELRADGLPPGANSKTPNFGLFWKLVFTARVFYRLLTLLLLVVLGAVGTYIVSQSAWETSNPTLAWTAWGVALLNCALEVYSSWWNVVLRGMNRVVTGMRILCLGYSAKLLLSCVLLMAGFGVLSVFVAGFLSSALIRTLSRRQVILSSPPAPQARPAKSEMISFLRILWPNSWRIGLQWITAYVAALLLMLICESRFGLAGAGEYGFSLNVAMAIQAIAVSWVYVKWPVIVQLRSRNELGEIRKLMWGRVWLETLTFVGLALVAFAVIPLVIKVGLIKKDVLPSPWFIILVANVFLEAQMAIWSTLLTTENKVPTLWPVAITHGCTLLLVFILLRTTQVGIGALALAPLVTGSLFNYWYWARRGPRMIGTTWARFMFQSPQAEAKNAGADSSPSVA
ncbi:MAG TPA: hypothetical protein VF773_19650 [Verrucomicrobiae bacterium]